LLYNHLIMEYSPAHNAPEFQWRDLSTDEVYFVAHMENEARDQAASMLARLAFTNDPISNIEGAKTLLQNADARAESWLIDQAALKNGELPKLQFMDEADEPETLQGWLRNQQHTLQLSGRDLARAAGVNATWLSSVKSTEGRSVSLKSMQKLASAIADARGLDGETRDDFIANALKFGKANVRQ
jgi:hypothetical protein